MDEGSCGDGQEGDEMKVFDEYMNLRLKGRICTQGLLGECRLRTISQVCFNEG